MRTRHAPHTRASPQAQRKAVRFAASIKELRAASAAAAEAAASAEAAAAAHTTLERARRTSLPPQDEHAALPGEVRVGECDIEGTLLKRSDWVHALRPRYFYCYGRALMYYHEQPRMQRESVPAEGGAAVGATAVRFVSDRPSDGQFILSAPPFESKFKAPSFGFAVPCVGRSQPLFLFGSSAEDRDEWVAALGRTFFEAA